MGVPQQALCASSGLASDNPEQSLWLLRCMELCDIPYGVVGGGRNPQLIVKDLCEKKRSVVEQCLKGCDRHLSQRLQESVVVLRL